MNLERELKQALGRMEAPAGFTERVMSRLEPPRRAKMPPRWAPWAVAASLLVSTGGSGYLYQQRQERATAERARQQILVALQITGSKLDHVRAKIRSVSAEEN